MDGAISPKAFARALYRPRLMDRHKVTELKAITAVTVDYLCDEMSITFVGKIFYMADRSRPSKRLRPSLRSVSLTD